MVRTYMERLIDLDYVAVKTTYTRSLILRAAFGVGVLMVVRIFVADYFKLGKEPVALMKTAPEKA